MHRTSLGSATLLAALLALAMLPAASAHHGSCSLTAPGTTVGYPTTTVVVPLPGSVGPVSAGPVTVGGQSVGPVGVPLILTVNGVPIVGTVNVGGQSVGPVTVPSQTVGPVTVPQQPTGLQPITVIVHGQSVTAGVNSACAGDTVVHLTIDALADAERLLQEIGDRLAFLEEVGERLEDFVNDPPLP